MCEVDNDIKEVTKCECSDCQGEVGVDYVLEDLQEIVQDPLESITILVCPECFDVIKDETVDSDYSDMHPNDTVEDFHDSFDPDID